MKLNFVLQQEPKFEDLNVINFTSPDQFLPILAVLLCVGLIAGVAAAGKRRKIIIHVPVKVKAQKHTHTEVKTVHHHHKPTIIKEEKIIKKEVHKPVVIKEEVEHEHFHHHYKHDHPTFEVDGHESLGTGNDFGGL